MAPPRKTTKPPGRLFWIILSAVFLGAGLVVVYLAWQRHVIAQANVPSTCTVTAATLSYNSEDSRHAYTPKVILAHEIDGKRYERTDSGPSYSISSDAPSTLARFPVGSQQPCTYVAGHPELVSAFPGKDSGALVFGLFGVFLMLIPAGAYAFVRFRRR